MLKKCVFTIALIIAGIVSRAQSADGAQLAQLHAKRMQDSLGLSDALKQAVLAVNMDVFNRKYQSRKTHVNDIPGLVQDMQRIENSRDSLYNLVLPSEKYTLYQLKKTSLISN